MDYLLYALTIGIGATATTDLWAIFRRRIWSIALPNYGLVGRWLALMLRGRFRHPSMTSVPAVRGERLVGWLAHYAIGIAFAAILLGFCGLSWVHEPTLGPALLVGLGTVVAPFLVMQPGMGAGIAASRTPNPSAARLQSLVTHAFFGLGLYAAGWILHLWPTP